MEHLALWYNFGIKNGENNLWKILTSQYFMCNLIFERFDAHLGIFLYHGALSTMVQFWNKKWREQPIENINITIFHV